MKIKGREHIHPIIFFVAVITFILFQPFCNTGSNAYGLSIEDEKILGEKFLLEIRRRFVLVEDDFPAKYINDLGRYLTSPLETRPFPFVFYIVKDGTLNAFAAPGGHIFIFSGLIDAADNVDELAAVICHEIGHVSARHLANRLEQSKKIEMVTLAGVLVGILIGGEAADAIITSTLAAGMQTQLRYSRNDERQADQLGFKFIRPSGLDPTAMISILKKIQNAHWIGTDKVPPYLLTHPTGPERISNIYSMLSGYKPVSPKQETIWFRETFPYFKTMVVAECLEPRDAEKRFKHDLEEGSDSPLPYLGLGVVSMRRSEYAVAVEYLKKALEQKPDFIPILTTIAKAYEMNGQDREAIAVLEKVLDQDDRDKSATFLLALAYENMEEYEKEIRLLERLSFFKPVKADVYYHLGIAYGRKNRLALAHYNFGLYFKMLGRVGDAKFHFRKANDLSKGDPGLREKIQKHGKDFIETEHRESSASPGEHDKKDVDEEQAQ
jgi:predicted Zn-dependent protease